MSDTPGAKSSEAHLSRVRDNQRRSRARRKQYLQELEDKFRRCEQTGAEASFEMQTAARRVLQENSRLRSLLMSMGVSESKIDAFIGPVDAEYLASLPHLATAQRSPATQGLAHQLQKRKPCSSECSLDGPTEGVPDPSAAALHYQPEVEHAKLPTLPSSQAADKFELPGSYYPTGTYDHSTLEWSAPSDRSTGTSVRALSTGFTAVPDVSAPSSAHTFQSSSWPQREAPQMNGGNPLQNATAEDVYDSNDPNDSLQLLLSPTRQSRFLRYLGIEPPPPTLDFLQDQQQVLPNAGYAHDTPPQQVLSTSPSAYCHRTRTWKRQDDPCWITCSMIAADLEVEPSDIVAT